MAEKKRIGTMPCEGKRCASHAKDIPVVVFENDRGTLSYHCDYCDRGPYARAGTEQHAEWMADINLFTAKVKPSAAEPEKSAAPAAPAANQEPAPAAPGKKKMLFA